MPRYQPVKNVHPDAALFLPRRLLIEAGLIKSSNGRTAEAPSPKESHGGSPAANEAISSSTGALNGARADQVTGGEITQQHSLNSQTTESSHLERVETTDPSAGMQSSQMPPNDNTQSDIYGVSSQKSFTAATPGVTSDSPGTGNVITQESGGSTVGDIGASSVPEASAKTNSPVAVSAIGMTNPDVSQSKIESVGTSGSVTNPAQIDTNRNIVVGSAVDNLAGSGGNTNLGAPENGGSLNLSAGSVNMGKVAGSGVEVDANGANPQYGSSGSSTIEVGATTNNGQTSSGMNTAENPIAEKINVDTQNASDNSSLESSNPDSANSSPSGTDSGLFRVSGAPVTV